MVNIPTKLWIPVLTKPAVTFAKEAKKKAPLGDAIAIVALAILISSLLGVLAQGMMGSLLASPLEAIASLAIGTVFVTIIVLTMTGIMYLIAKFLGGKGEFKQQFYFYSLFGVPTMILGGVLGLIPMIGSILNIVLSVYVLWPLTLSIKQVHKIDTVRAVLAWLIPGIVVVILEMVLGMQTGMY
jgi:hypothetical protein